LTLARILALALVIAIIILAFVFRDIAPKLGAYGYVGIFVLSIVANATIIIPVPGIAITFSMGAIFNPVGVAFAAGAGAALGEITGYLVGFSGQGIIAGSSTYKRLEGWMERFGVWVVLVLAIIPNPLFDLAGVAAGALRMPIWKFLIWTWIGKTIKMLLIAYAGASSVDWLMNLFGSTP
jgi:membrane protein YqaA with SNARE-associated domain